MHAPAQIDPHGLADYLAAMSRAALEPGLNWEVVEKKWPGIADAFDGFAPMRVADYGPEDLERLMADPRIIRNRRKVESAVGNARAFLQVQEEFGTFDAFIWRFVGGAPRLNAPREPGDIPARTDESVALSKELVRRGFRFVGPTIVYSHMQACGLVNDHLVSCFRYRELGGKAGRPARGGRP
jgi:DNA-3-methyladenine glycosylase I